MDSSAVIDEAGVKAGDVVTVIGLEVDSLVPSLVERVGPFGVVHSLRTSCDDDERRSLDPLWSSRIVSGAQAELTGLNESVDATLLAFSFQQLTSPLTTLIEIRRCLRRGGRLAVVERMPKRESYGRSPTAWVSPIVCQWNLEVAGFAIQRHRALGESVYMILATRPD